jgi:hypothetical protein
MHHRCLSTREATRSLSTENTTRLSTRREKATCCCAHGEAPWGSAYGRPAEGPESSEVVWPALEVGLVLAPSINTKEPRSREGHRGTWLYHTVTVPVPRYRGRLPYDPRTYYSRSR